MRLKTLITSLFTASLISLTIALPALAIPPLPSSFYGTVKVNGANAPENTVVRALINGQAYAEARTQMYQGNSVVSLDVPGDDTSTPERDGGVEGDTIQFEVGGVLAVQTGTWHGGTNTQLNLTAASANPLNTPPPTGAPVPTQTPIPVAQLTRAPIASAAVPADNTRSIVLVVVAVIVVAAGGVTWVARRRR